MSSATQGQPLTEEERQSKIQAQGQLPILSVIMMDCGRGLINILKIKFRKNVKKTKPNKQKNGDEGRAALSERSVVTRALTGRCPPAGPAQGSCTRTGPGSCGGSGSSAPPAAPQRPRGCPRRSA